MALQAEELRESGSRKPVQRRVRSPFCAPLGPGGCLPWATSSEVMLEVRRLCRRSPRTGSIRVRTQGKEA